MATVTTPPPPLLPGLMDDLATECLMRVRLDCQTLRHMRAVCKRWRQMLLTYDSYLLKLRRFRDMQCPSLLMVPDMHTPKLEEISFYACLPYKSSILVLGGNCDGRSRKDFWIVDTLRRTIKRGPDMISHREDFVCAVVDETLFAIGGEDVDGRRWGAKKLVHVERYDFVTQKWSAVSPLPIPTMTYKCYVDSVSSPPKLYVSGIADVNREDIPVTFCYCKATDTWTGISKDEYESLVQQQKPQSHTGSSARMWCSGSVMFRKEFLEEDLICDPGWLFPFDIKFPADFIAALLQPTRDGYDHDDIFTRDDLEKNIFVVAKEDVQTNTAFITGEIEHFNASFNPLSVATEFEPSSMVWEIVATAAMRAEMQFCDKFLALGCTYATIFL